MANAITSALPLFASADGLLDGAFVYIGIANLDPETNPVAVYWDEALTQVAPQPLRTTGGMIARNGSPAHVHIAVDYSMTVKDSRGVVVYYMPVASAAATAINEAVDAADAAQAAALAASSSANAASASATAAGNSATAAGLSVTAAGISATNAASSASSASSSAAAAAASAVYAPFFGGSTYVSSGNAGNTLRVDGLVRPNTAGVGSIGTSAGRWAAVFAGRLEIGTATTGPTIGAGLDSPEGLVSAEPGSTWHRTNGGVFSTLYVKESGTGNTGWHASIGSLVRAGSGSPEGVVTAAPGTFYLRTDPTSGQPAQYTKATGTGNTGWIGGPNLP